MLIIHWIVEGIYPNEKNILFICKKEYWNRIEQEFLKGKIQNGKTVKNFE